MTEAEWLDAVELWPMLEYAKDRYSVRKLRLLGNAFMRRYCLPDVAHAADKLDRQVEAPEFTDYPNNAANFAWQIAQSCLNKLYHAAVAGYDRDAHAAHVAAGTHPALYGALWAEAAGPEAAAQCRLARCVFGNPFRPVNIDPSWRTANVTAIAQVIYEERRFEDLPILTDALEEAGCDDEDILSHCRTGKDHARGCWVVDALLGKS